MTTGGRDEAEQPRGRAFTEERRAHVRGLVVQEPGPPRPVATWTRWAGSACPALGRSPGSAGPRMESARGTELVVLGRAE